MVESDYVDGDVQRSAQRVAGKAELSVLVLSVPNRRLLSPESLGAPRDHACYSASGKSICERHYALGGGQSDQAPTQNAGGAGRAAGRKQALLPAECAARYQDEHRFAVAAFPAAR